MARKREFDPAVAVAAAAEVFAWRGYEGASMDLLVRATGVHRGSLYAMFGSKRGLFLACLQAADDDAPEPGDVWLVALTEMAHRDDEVRALCADRVTRLGPGATGLIGARVLARAGVAPVDR